MHGSNLTHGFVSEARISTATYGEATLTLDPVMLLL